MSPSDKDLFEEEQQMVSMSFGDHIEELRVRIILALLGLMVGSIITFIPPLDIGKWVMNRMQAPAQASLEKFYAESYKRRADEAKKTQAVTPPFDIEVEGEALAKAVAQLFPDLRVADASALKKKFPLRMSFSKSDFIQTVGNSVETKAALITLAPLEAFMIYFWVCLITGLVLTSPWVFYQAWAFVAAGLYRHERHYVLKFLPFSLGLFLGGVFLCFFAVLPVTLSFLLDFNVWLGAEPTLRLTDWISFATVLPLVFGVCFQTPLVMMVLERVGIFRVEDYRAKRKFAIMILVIVAAVITPTGDPFTLALLSVPMIGLYELGILLVSRNARKDVPATMAG
jgi:sec-independent protein translocase protein TatC